MLRMMDVPHWVRFDFGNSNQIKISTSLSVWRCSSLIGVDTFEYRPVHTPIQSFEQE